MESKIKTLTIEQLANLIQGRLWEKADKKRIYLEEGYNTKKMSTKTYIFQRQDQTYGVSCKIECTVQHDNWIEKEQKDIEESVTKKITQIIDEHGYEIDNPQFEIKAALEAETQVQGYFMHWREVRVPINRFGKLATRKRMQVCTYKGAISKSPAGLIELNDDDFTIAIEKENNEALYEYGNEPNLIGEAERIADRKATQEAKAKANEEKIAQEKEQLAADLKNKIDELKAQGVESPLLAWKQLGFPHPAPAEIVEMKTASGFNWKDFQNSIQ